MTSHNDISQSRGAAAAPRRSPVASRALAAGALLLLALGACKGKDADAKEADSAASTPAVTVGPENMTVAALTQLKSGPSFSGSLAPDREAAIRAEVPGRIVRILAEPGQRVGTGTLLAVIDVGGAAENELSARAGVRTAELSYQNAQRNEERAERLAQAGAIAERDLEQARTASAAARAQLDQARAGLALATRQVGNTQVRAPFSGIVATRTASAGDVVAPGAALFTVVDPSSMKLEASIPAEQLSLARIGAPVSFGVNGYPGRTFSGTITRVSPVADPTTRQVRIIATIPNTGGNLVGGLFAQGRVASESRAAVTVPANAVDQRGLAPTVVRLRAGRAEKVTVQLGLRDEAAETLEIRSGLTAGDTVLLGIAQGITPGTPVRVSAPNDVKK